MDDSILLTIMVHPVLSRVSPACLPGSRGERRVPTPWPRTPFRPERGVPGGPASTAQFSTVPSGFLTSTSPVITTLVLLLFLFSPRRGQGELQTDVAFMAGVLYELLLIGQSPHDEFYAPWFRPSTRVLHGEPVKKVVFIQALPAFGEMCLLGVAIGESPT